MKKVPQLKKHYTEVVVPALKQSRGYTNPHQVPRITKVVLNTGIDAGADKTVIADTQRDLTAIAGQKAVLTKARKAIANFKLREGQTVGATVTLRGDNMWHFLSRLLVVALPTIRDFRGVPTKFDGNGNYNLGVTDYSIFPEISLENTKRMMGLDISVVTTAASDDEGRELLKLLGFPFRRTEGAVAAAKTSTAA
ncbi:MAG TPA: 50S ribosomal protein L5 [Opitutaceae bacterium]|nr:50S ribosomal protein L5 [Opitutaceae bacterium]